ncbi:hypothetical protein BDP55DRAFT_635790 [Colletotrichum godetiae]|uniref:Uncharacterized protein n=1 Tax=Colletotrichum godetiae TaxID=1209918 RepID=A0AAJ0ETS5_9PEZI|nr:uncharacterized protein BDP55DRAFT_635790 [Colletotrichum godetiae]KAK1671544.1 hypothetical protein BDP55DRAFT_635790 [Colletotrichum godetiae]
MPPRAASFVFAIRLVWLLLFWSGILSCLTTGNHAQAEGELSSWGGCCAAAAAPNLHIYTDKLPKLRSTLHTTQWCLVLLVMVKAGSGAGGLHRRDIGKDHVLSIPSEDDAGLVCPALPAAQVLPPPLPSSDQRMTRYIGHSLQRDLGSCWMQEYPPTWTGFEDSVKRPLSFPTDKGGSKDLDCWWRRRGVHCAIASPQPKSENSGGRCDLAPYNISVYTCTFLLEGVRLDEKGLISG